MAKDNVTETQNLENLNFDKDKKFLLQKTEEYLRITPNAPGVKNTEMEKPLIFTRNDIKEEIEKGNLDKALKKLEKLRDLKSGITHEKITNEDGISVLVRDARKCKEKPIRSTESFEMQYLNAIRAAIDIANLDEPKNIILAKELQKKTNNFTQITEQKELAGKNLSEQELKDLSKLVKAEIKNLAKTMEENGIKNSYKALNVAKDCQNFNDEQFNIVTISEINGQIIIEAEVGFRQLIPKQKQEYQNIADGKDQPEWFNKLPEWEQKLTKKYAAKIAEGTHVIPTQLRQIAGMRNAFEKITAVLEDKGENKDKLKILHTSKHAGTLASLNKDKKASEAVTLANAMQAQTWVGADKILHCNTLNAAVIGSGDDPRIVSSTEKIMKQIKGRITNTSFNAFRLLGIANNYDGVIASLDAIAKTNPDLKAHIMPRSKLERLFGLNKPKNNAEAILANIKEPEKSIYKKAIELREAVEKADVPFRLFFDKENINSVVSGKLNLLTKQINDNPNSFPDMKREEMLTMCASGKDRTGLAEHDQTVQVIMDQLNKRLSSDLTEIINDKLGQNDKKTDLKLTMDPNTARQVRQTVADHFNKKLANDLTKIINNELGKDGKEVNHKLTPNNDQQAREAVANKLKINIKDIDPKLFTEKLNAQEIAEMLASKHGIKARDIDLELFTGGHSAEEIGQMLTTKNGIKIQDIDHELIKNGHTAQAAGGINSGGGTIGCFGTKKENKTGIPVSRAKNLQGIIEVSASTNKIKGEDRPITKAERKKIELANEIANQPAPTHAKLQKMLQANKNITNENRPISPPQTPPVNSTGKSNDKSLLKQ